MHNVVLLVTFCLISDPVKCHTDKPLIEPLPSLMACQFTAIEQVPKLTPEKEFVKEFQCIVDPIIQKPV